MTITPIADGIVEETESILITGSAPGLGASTATVLLTDSTVGHGSGGGGGAIVSIAPPSGETSEGSIAELTISLSHSVAAAVTVAFHVTPGTADASDYTEPALSTVTFPANSAAGATQTIAVATNQDLLSEGAESFTVTLGTVTGDLAPRVSVDPDRAAATATIAESDPISISLSGPAEADEGAEATYTVSLSLSGVIPTRELTVTYATSDGTALAGSDYAPATGTLSFTQDSPGAKTFTVHTTEDILTEARETFTVSIAVTYSTSDGTALAGSDYASAPGTISSTQESAGDRIVTVGTAGNTATESGETSSASSSGPAGDGGPAPTLGTYSVTTTIADDDEPVPAAAATPTPTREPAGGPASTPRPTQTPQPTWGHLREPVPTPTPTPEPTSTPAPEPTREATPTPRPEPTPGPAQELTREPTPTPTPEPVVPWPSSWRTRPRLYRPPHRGSRLCRRVSRCNPWPGQSTKSPRPRWLASTPGPAVVMDHFMAMAPAPAGSADSAGDSGGEETQEACRSLNIAAGITAHKRTTRRRLLRKPEKGV